MRVDSGKIIRACQGTFVLAGIIGMSHVSTAQCVSIVKGPIVMDAASCGVLDPVASFDLNSERFRFIKEFAKPEQKKFFDSYRGLIIKGKVVSSQAVKSGLTEEKGALKGEDISVFVFPGKGKCDGVSGGRIDAVIEQACCAGGANPPCLLQSPYFFKSYKVIGKASSAAGDTDRKQAEKLDQYVKADNFYKKRDYKKAAALYETVRVEGKLDLKGYYKLGDSYRELDRCTKAIPVLEYVFEKSGKDNYWADEEAMVRKSNFLLARCYSKTNNPGKAVVILEGYLVDRKKYRQEISDSLSHPDFGWIKTTKEYLKYVEEVESNKK
ncbi:MAG: hypothetical protein HQK54_00150 [Oligoflexales bacterium]|nr:hypothetical protein [Oligoflexales bacterium]